MKKLFFLIPGFIICSGLFDIVSAQTVPVGTPVLEDYYRRKQLTGELDSTISFSVRPLSVSALKNVTNVYDPDSTLRAEGWLNFDQPFTFANGKGKFQILPFTWQHQFNSQRPYGWNDGAMIPAKGYQTLISGGFFAKFGPLSIQFRPEYVSATNDVFDGFAKGKSDADIRKYYNAYNYIDAPERFGTGAYNKLLLGQSSIRLTFGPASFGFSNENLWWGPGVRNSLIMGNSAPGFRHFTLNTVRPVNIYIGSLEAQIIGGRITSSGYSPLPKETLSTGMNVYSPKDGAWRYLAGLNLVYQPKWVPGLFFGFTRTFVSYGRDVNSFGDYFPFFVPFQKNAVATFDDPFDRDQRTSLFARWIFTKAKAEVYFEFAKNDNAYNFREFLTSPDHSKAYLFGVRKLVPLKGRTDEFIQINGEITQLSQSLIRTIKDAGNFYTHSRVREGYTHLGQRLGAGTDGNLQSLDINWVKGLKKLGLTFERYEHNVDFYNRYIQDLDGQSRKWVDFSLAAQGEWNYKNLLFNAKFQAIKSLNSQWLMADYAPGTYYIPHNDKYNIHGEFGISYRF
ncbi:capsule assembly Wzi family protein [Pedobacter sp. B4-66]|uniref:capsule assembly Wzi family protein n=1 Tax=Pedobacter sp. B4-66 TaxID=2817280 RepID=UPI001BDB4E40|nr:capsule assembly Wzi family protein [Pedobacter sp. B4-66]